MPDEPPDALEQDRRLDEAITAYLKAVESGSAPNREEWLSHHKDLAGALRQFLEDQDRVNHWTAPLRSAVEAGKLHAPPAPDFGDYELLEEIGRGGMGVVYKARQKNPNPLVALKMIRGDRVSSREQVRPFRNEAEAAARLDHPNVVPIYEVGERAGQPFFSMKLLEGGPLAASRPRYVADPRATARLVAEVARAVHHARQRGILHRDLKPSNVLLDEERRPHVADFGLAKWTETD